MGGCKPNRTSAEKPTWYPRETQNLAQLTWQEKEQRVLGLFLAPALVTTLVAAVVEAFTPADLDNLTVPLAALGALWIMIPALNWWQVPFIA